nr:PAS domain S-box protein [Deltaproteobacteria bacterium]
MPGPALPVTEAARLHAVRSYQILDTPAEQAFDELAQLAADACLMPTALITMVDEHRQWFKSRVSFGPTETAREFAFCAYAILQRGVFEVPDTANDPRFADNPYVLGAPCIRFYAGVPLLDVDGHALGTVAVLDYVPRELGAPARRALQGIAKQVIAQLELRRRMLAARRHSEHAIQRSEALTSALIDAALDCVIAIDQDGRIIEFNPAAERTFGRTRVDVLGKIMSDLLMPPGLRALHERGLAAHLASGLRTNIGRRLELTGLRADGREFPLELSITRVATEPPIFAGFIRDLTDRKRAERELRESAERFELVTRATHDVVWDWDLQSNALWWSQAIEQFGHDGAGLGERAAWIDLLHPDDRAAVKHGLDEALASGAEHWHAEYQLRRGDGTYATVLDRGYILRDEERRPLRMIGVIMDTTERRRLEAQLLQAQKMEAIGQLAGGIAHDFNNVLTVIQCNAYLLDRNAPERDTNAQEILQATERAASLTRQLLLFSRHQRLRTQAIDFDEVVRNMIRMLKRTLGEHVTVIARSAPSLPAIEADASMLEQVLLNLAVNARDAMPDGGTLTIETDTVSTEQRITDFGLDAAAGTYVTLTVRDTGAGIPPSVLPQIFDPFFTTKELGKGTGLGLATVL